jgi:hypothetical protein
LPAELQRFYRPELQLENLVQPSSLDQTFEPQPSTFSTKWPKRLIKRFSDDARPFVVRPDLPETCVVFFPKESRTKELPWSSYTEAGKERVAKEISGRITTDIINYYAQDWRFIKWTQDIQVRVNDFFDRHSMSYISDAGSTIKLSGVLNYDAHRYLGLRGRGDVGYFHYEFNIYPEVTEARIQLMRTDGLKLYLGGYQSLKHTKDNAAMILVQRTW